MSLRSVALRLLQDTLKGNDAEKLLGKLGDIDNLITHVPRNSIQSGFSQLDRNVRLAMLDGLHDVIKLAKTPEIKAAVARDYMETFRKNFSEGPAGQQAFNKFQTEFATELDKHMRSTSVEVAKPKGSAPNPKGKPDDPNMVDAEIVPPGSKKPSSTAKAKPIDVKPIEVKPTILDFIDGMATHTLQGKDSSAIRSAFKDLRALLSENHPDLLVTKLETRREKALNPAEIIQNIRDGRPVTRDELNRAETSYITRAENKVAADAEAARKAEAEAAAARQAEADAEAARQAEADAAARQAEADATAARKAEEDRVLAQQQAGARAAMIGDIKSILDANVPDQARLQDKFAEMRRVLGEQGFLDSSPRFRASDMNPDDLARALAEGRPIHVDDISNVERRLLSAIDQEANLVPSNIPGLTVGDVRKIAAHVQSNPDYDPAIARAAFPDVQDFAAWQTYRNHVVSEKMGQAIPDAMRKLDKSVGLTDRMDVDDFFAKTADLLRDPAKNQLVKSLKETGRNQEIGSYKNIVSAIQRGDKVTEDEYFALAKFFGANLDTVGVKATQQPVNPGFFQGANKLSTVVAGLSKMTDMISSSAAQKPKSGLRMLISEYESETRTRPAFFSREGFLNRVLDNPKSSAAAAAALLIGSNFATTYVNPQEAGVTSAAIFQILYPGSLFTNDNALEQEDDTTIRQVIAYRSGKGMSEQFVTDTKKYTGLDIQIGQTVLDPKTLYDIASALQTRGTSGTNPRDFRAYLFALFAFSNASVPMGADGKTPETSDMIANLVKINEIAQIRGTANALLVGDGTSKGFIDATQKFAGIPLTDKTDKVSELDPEMLYTISVNMQNRGVGQSNNRDVTGYLIALAKKSMMADADVDKHLGSKDDDKTASGYGALLNDIVTHNRERYVTATMGQLVGVGMTVQGINKEFRDSFFRNYLGTEALPEDPAQLNQMVLNKYASTLGSPDLRQPVIQRYLEVAAGVPKESSSPDKIREFMKNRETQDADRQVAEASRKSQETANAFAANAGATHERSPAPVSSKEKKECAISPEDAKNYFNTLAEGDVYQQLKGKGSALSEAYKAAAGNKALFEKTLQERVSGLPKNVVQNVSADIFPCP